MKKKTHEEYIEELKIKNPTVEVVDRYDGLHKKIMHHCLVHDIYWELQPANALRGDGCEKCHKERQSGAKVKSHEQYVEELKITNPHVVVLEQYKNSKVPMLYKCLKHNIEWRAIPSNVLKGCGCPECLSEKIAEKRRKTHNQYVTELKLVNPDVTVIEEYIDAKTPILHKCLIDGYEWRVIPDSILHGYGCPRCQESSGERQVRQWLDNYHIDYIYQKCFDDCRDKLPLPFDFYLPDYNAAIEYQGKQHYSPVEHFGGEEKLSLQQKHDKIKSDYCKAKNIKLFIIPYNKDINEELNNFLFI